MDRTQTVNYVNAIHVPLAAIRRLVFVPTALLGQKVIIASDVRPASLNLIVQDVSQDTLD